MIEKSPSPAQSAEPAAGSFPHAGPGATSDASITTVSRGNPAKGRTDWAKVDALDDAQIAAAVADDADAVPLDFDWSDAEVVLPERKTPISIRVDPDVLDFFKGGGAGYQRRINAVLRSYVDAARRRGRE